MKARTIDEKFVLEHDERLIAEDAKLHQRPFHVALAWMRENGVSAPLFDPAIWTPLMDIYRKLYPTGDFNMPNLFEGGVAIRDRMYKVKVYVGFGTNRIEPLKSIEISPRELEVVFKHYPDDGWRALYGVADVWDFAYGIDDLSRNQGPEALLLSNARSSVASTARTLIGDLDIDSAVQTACLSAELAMKGALASLGWTEKQYRNLGHDLVKAAEALSKAAPRPSDAMLLGACAQFPDYVKTRYADHGLSRKELMSLAMRAQYVAAEAVRRITDRDLAGQIGADSRNPPRAPW